nr:hypothetical protein [Tanacetum cinerariifolium]
MGIDLPLIWAVIIIFGIMIALSAADLHAHRADFPRRGVRVPFQGHRRQASPLGQSVHRRFAGGDVLPGRGTGRVHRRDSSGQPRLCRGRTGLADTVLTVLRPGADRGLRIARLHLADHEDRRRSAEGDARPGPSSGDCDAGGDGHRQPVDAAGASGHRRPLVQRAEPVLVHAGPCTGPGDHV